MAFHDHARHDAAQRTRVAAPTLSLLRLSAAQRLAGAGAVLALLWALVLLVIGWV